jgi:outer membrane receptor protein involved in Fe transport
METANLGSFNFVLRATNTREFKTRLRPNTPITDTLDQILAPLHFRGSGSAAWRKGNWTVTPSWTYIESYRDSLNVPVDNSLTTNLQVVYNLPFGTTVDRWLGLLQGTQWTLGMNNVFDREPPYVFNPGGQNFRSFYSTFDDPRGRYVYLRIRKTF